MKTLMPGNIEHRQPDTGVIKRNVKIFNWIVLLIVSVHLFLIIQFLYLILADFLHSYFIGKNIIDKIFSTQISAQSGITIFSIVTGLVVIGLYLVNTASKNAITNIEEYNNKLNALMITTRDICEIIYGDLLLDKILTSSLKITGANAGSILLTKDNKLVFKTVKGIESSKLLGHSIQKSRSIAGWVVENGSITRINDVKNDNRFDLEIDKITGYETKSVLCAPLKSSTETIGALELLNKDGAFIPEDEELISYFADQAAVSIARSKFYEDQKNYEIHLTEILLNAIDSHPEKHGHSTRVAKYSLLIAKAMNLSEDEKRILYRASLLHDIGFIKMKTVLSKEEYKTHPQIGYEMLEPINFYADISSIILHHHERFDGNGYPSGLKGENIPLGSRIIAIAEAFDAMVSINSYKYIEMDSKDIKPSVKRFHAAIDELRKNAGTQFDPAFVEAFANNINESHLE